MRLITPVSLHYPITVTKLLYKVDEDVAQNAPLFDYQYKSKVIEGSEDDREGKLVERTWTATFESYSEGSLASWYISEGKVITRPGTAIAEIEEPCKHEVQFGGMCAVCGKDMTTVQYNTVTRDTARATVNTVHGHTALLVSQAEASKSDEEAKRRLLSSRKLSLVVDLDQTIIHATVDPTVAEWQSDTSNPNYDAVKEVRAFQLVDDGPGARGCWYYIKLRPGLKEFLENISKVYELHIYTMGTRAYAQNIAQIVDPDRKIFADRILSRDESGSLTVKNLKRLFPVDTKMVVIIDDRGDVWHWSQNLIKVSAYDFFVGIGDINSSFLPKRPELEASPPNTSASMDNIAKPDLATSAGSSANGNGNGAATTQHEALVAGNSQTNGDMSAIDQLVSMGGGNDPNKLQAQTSAQDETIAAQLADRPLLQKQKILDAVEDNAGRIEASSAPTENNEGQMSEHTPDAQSKYRHNLLQDDDTELRYLEKSLQEVHRSFFDEYERNLSAFQGGRVAQLRPGHSKKRSFDDLTALPDVTTIMANMKHSVLKGVHVVFSGVVPLGVNFQSHDLAIWAKSFGATVTENITKRTTHVIASPHRRTAKVRQAAKKADRIKIVTQRWLFDSLSQWRKLAEGPYRIHSDIREDDEKPLDTNGSPFDEPDGTTVLSSSDEEAAATEEEGETPNGLQLKTDFGPSQEEVAELEAYMPSISREDSSPHEETNEDWEGMNDELADFLGSDDDGESGSDAESTQSRESESNEDSTSSGKKRKRQEKLDVSIDGEESDASLSGSRLQKRKKKALARTSSLTNSAASTSSLPAAPLRGGEDPGGGETDQKGTEDKAVDNDDDEDEDDAALEAELEAEMLRQGEEDEDED